ncbi:MAG TPA: response regulator [Cyanobacteria bacterium UBA8156]|jgi:DNA-binding response OmpR family regulator|nr:response regulator [Cyanobacteria bacterium UBA8156]
MTSKKVLVIDDSIMIRKMVKSILAGKFEVLEANDGKTGLEVARRSSPDLILLDFVMPKYNGYQTLQAMRRFDNLRDTPVIMISGLKEQVAEHVPEPFVGFEFLEKPFESEVLIERINNLLHLDEAAVETAPVPSNGVTTAPAPVTAVVGDGKVIDKISAMENLLIQGIENLIQREVAMKVNELLELSRQQDAKIASLEKQLAHLSENQNKYLSFLVQGMKALQTRLGATKP